MKKLITFQCKVKIHLQLELLCNYKLLQGSRTKAPQ